MLLNGNILFFLFATNDIACIGALPAESGRNEVANQFRTTMVPLQTVSQLTYLLCGENAVLNKTMRALEVRCYDNKPDSEYKHSPPDCGCLDGYMRNSANACIKASDCVSMSNGYSSSGSERVDKGIVFIICSGIVDIGYIMSFVVIMYVVLYFFRS